MPPRPKQPDDKGTVTPPQGPIQGLQGEKGEKGDPGEPGKDGKDADDKTILLTLFEKIKNDPQFKGPKGDKGDPGQFDHTKMPLFVLQFTDKNGQVVEERPFKFNQTNNRFEVQIDPIHVQNFDSDSKLVDEEKYPYPGPIKLRHGAKVPATTGPST